MFEVKIFAASREHLETLAADKRQEIERLIDEIHFEWDSWIINPTINSKITFTILVRCPEDTDKSQMVRLERTLVLLANTRLASEYNHTFTATVHP